MKGLLELKFPFKKKEEEIPKQEIPIKDITDIVETKDGKFKLILKVTDPINSELLSDEDVQTSIQAIQDCCNALEQKAQVLVSSERIDVSGYIQHLRSKAEEAKDNYTLERIEEKIKFLEVRSNTSRTVHNFYFVIESKFKKLNDAYDELTDLSQSFMEYLEFGDMGTKQLTADEIKKVLYEKLNPETSLTQPYTPDINLQSISPNVIKDQGSYLIMDDWYYSFYTFSYFPDEVQPTWLKRVFNTRANLDFSLLLSPTDKTEIMKSTSRKITAIEERLAGKLPPMFKMRYEKEQKSLTDLLDELQNDSENLFSSAFIVAIREKTKDELESAEKRLETAISSSKLRSKKIVFKGNQLIWYTLPICYSNPDFERQISWPMQSSTLASILPFDSSELQNNEGILKGFHAKKDSPIIYNRFNKGMFNNPNEVVFGESGSGKSYYLRLDMLRESTSGKAKRIFVIDPEREYFLPNAQRIVFKLGSEFTTNPFHIRSAIVDSDDENEDGKSDVGSYLRLKIGESMSFFKWIMPDMTPREKADLLKAIVHIYEDKSNLTYESTNLPAKFPTLSDLYVYLQDNLNEPMQNVISTLNPYVHVENGVYASMFDGQTNWDLNSKINVLDIHELSEEIQKPMYDLLLKEVWEEIKKDREEEIGFYVDEAHILADEENLQTMKFLFTLYKRIRKYGGFSTVATQNVADYLSIGKYGTAILNNAFIKTFMRMAEEDINTLKKFMSFSEKELKILGMKKSQGRSIHIAGGKRIEMQTKASLDELKIVDPKQAAKLEVS